MIWVLVIALIASICVSVLLWGKLRKGRLDDDIQPLDNGLVIFFVFISIVVVLISFLFLMNTDLGISNNIGQVGDFIGGLLNPILSLIALLVLLRNSVIQSSESRKTAQFLKEQVEISKHEKFENTFFELLRHAESYAEVHMRKVDSNGKTNLDKLCGKIIGAAASSSKLSRSKQLRFALDFVNRELVNDVNETFFLRFLRVIRFVNSSKLDNKLKSSYMNMISNAMYAKERLVFAHMVIRFKLFRKVLRKWKLVSIKKEVFLCAVLGEYFERR